MGCLSKGRCGRFGSIIGVLFVAIERARVLVAVVLGSFLFRVHEKSSTVGQDAFLFGSFSVADTESFVALIACILSCIGYHGIEDLS